NDPQGTDTVIIYEPYVSSETFVSEYGSLITGTHMESSSVEIFEFISMESSNSDSLWLSLAAGSIGVSSPESTASVSASIEDSILGSSWLEITDAWSITVEPTSTKYSSSNDDYLSVVSSVVSSDEPSSLQESSADWSSSSKNVYASETTDDWSTIPTDEIDGDSSDFTTIESATSVDETNDPLLSTLPLESSSAAIGESIYSCDLSSHDYYVSSESVEDYSTITDVSSSDLWSSSATSETEESPEYSSTEEATSSEFSEVSDLVSSSVTTPAWSSDYVEMPSASEEDSSSIIDETSSSVVLSSFSTIRYWNSSIPVWSSPSSVDPVEYVSTTDESSITGSPLSFSETTDPPSISVIGSWSSESSDFSSTEESASETGEVSSLVASSTDNSADVSISTDELTDGYESSYSSLSSSIRFLSETDIHSILSQIETIEHIETSYQSQETLDTISTVSMMIFTSDILSNSQSDELSCTIKSTENWSEAEFTDTFDFVGGTRVPRGGGAPWRTESSTITSSEQSLESDDHLSQSATLSEYIEETSFDFDSDNESELMPSSEDSELVYPSESISETTFDSLIDVSDLVLSTFSTNLEHLFLPSESLMVQSNSSAETTSFIDSDEIASSTESYEFTTTSETGEYSTIAPVEESGVIASDPVFTSLTLHNATIESSDIRSTVSVQVVEEITSVYSMNMTTTTSVYITSELISASPLPTSMIEDFETSNSSDEQSVSSLTKFPESMDDYSSIYSDHSSTNFTLSVESIPSSEIALSSNVYNNSTAEEVETITSASTSTDTERYHPIYTLSEEEQESTTFSYPLSIAGPPTINPSPSSNMNETIPHNTGTSHIASSSDTLDEYLTGTWLEQSQSTDWESDVLMTESTDGLSVSKSISSSEGTDVSSEQDIYFTSSGSHDVYHTDDDEHSTTISETQYSHEETYIELSFVTDVSTTVSQSTISADYSSSENIPMISNAPDLSENSDNWLTRFPNITTTNEFASSVLGFEPVPSTTPLFPLQPNSDLEMSSRAHQSYSNKTVSAVNFNSAESDTTFANSLLSTGVVDAISSNVINLATPKSEYNDTVIAMTISESSNSFDTLSSIHEPDVSNILKPFVSMSTTTDFPKHGSNIGNEYTIINDVIQIKSKTLSSDNITQTGKSDITATVIPDLQGTTLTYEVYNNLNTSISPVSTIYIGSGFTIKQSLSMMSLIFSVLIFL
ncbi:Dumpy, partial [Candida maltosa Xu316]